MNKFRIVTLVWVLIGSLSSAFAAESILTSKDFFSDAAEHFVGDSVGGFYNTVDHRANWLSMGLLAGSALGTYLLYEYVDDEIGDTTLISDNATYSDIVNGASFSAYAAPAVFLVAGWFFAAEDPRRHRHWIIAEELVESLGFEVVTTYVLKQSIDRQNPAGLGTNSFPSGHTSAAFTVATILAYHYPWYVGVGSFAAATLVSLERFDSRQHFPSDLLAGAGIATFFATAVHQFHASLRAKEQRPQETSMILPWLSDETTGMLLRYDF